MKNFPTHLAHQMGFLYPVRLDASSAFQPDAERYMRPYLLHSAGRECRLKQAALPTLHEWKAFVAGLHFSFIPYLSKMLARVAQLYFEMLVFQVCYEPL